VTLLSLPPQIWRISHVFLCIEGHKLYFRSALQRCKPPVTTMRMNQVDQKHKYVLHTRNNELINISLLFSFEEGKQVKFYLSLEISKCVTRNQMLTLKNKMILCFMVICVAGWLMCMDQSWNNFVWRKPKTSNANFSQFHFVLKNGLPWDTNSAFTVRNCWLNLRSTTWQTPFGAE